jgi:hypothetical protein
MLFKNSAAHCGTVIEMKTMVGISRAVPVLLALLFAGAGFAQQYPVKPV